MKQLTDVDYILASTYECAQRCARTSGIKHGWKFLYSAAHIHGIYGGTILICDCSYKRVDYDYLMKVITPRGFTILSAPYHKELL